MTLALLAFALLEPVRLEDLDLSRWNQGFDRPQADQSVARRPLRVAGQTFAHGVGTHAPSLGRYRLDGQVAWIEGLAGLADTGSGSVVLSIWGDGKRLWTSGTMRRNDPAQSFRVPLAGVRELVLATSDAMDGSGGDHAAWLDVRLQANGVRPQSLPPMKPLTLLPSQPRQTIDNFGASDSWTVEPLIRWPEARRREIARLLFDPTTGAGLSGWRHNLGGGINHETISMPLRTVATYDAGEGKFDFTQNPGKRWMLEAAKNSGVSRIVAYAITPPRRLTRNGFTNGTDGLGSTNLKDGADGAFARYLAGIVEHYRKLGYPITHLSPINEPDFEWNAGSQEGSRASNLDIMRQTRAIAEELKARSLPVRILTPEASSPQVGFGLNDGMTRKYKAPYGNYANFFADEADWRREVNPVYGYHSYWADGTGAMVDLRRKLRVALDRTPGMEVWMTEYCQLQGPRGEGGWGRDLGMTLALNLARIVTLDMTIVEAQAWQWWLAVSDADYKDGLIYVDDLDKPDGTVYPSKALWALGHFARFVRPGYRRILTEGPFGDVGGTLASAYQDPSSKRIVAVFVNTETSSDSVRLQVPGSWRARAWITSDRPGHDLRPGHRVARDLEVEVPSRSIVTVVLEPAHESGF